MRITTSVVFYVLLLQFKPSISQEIMNNKIKSNGEETLFWVFGNIFGKETRNIPDHERFKLREVSDGRRIISAIYYDDIMEDCEFGRNKKQIENLRLEKKFRNVSSPSDITDLSWLNFTALNKDCRGKKSKLNRRRRSLLSSKPRRHSRSKYMYRTRHDRLAVDKYHIKQNLITPGTKWCGPSNQAKVYTDLGGFWKADKCCRKHDICDKSISPFSYKYSITNNGPFTMSHCNCDKRQRIDYASMLQKRPMNNNSEKLAYNIKQGNHCLKLARNSKNAANFTQRFRKCLKLADTGASKFVGKLFFNYIQTKCFTTKVEKICSKRSWKGKCLSSSYEMVGQVKDNVYY